MGKMQHKLRKIRPGVNNSFSGPAVSLACDTCRVATLARTEERARELHDEIASDPEKLERLQVKDEQFWLENYHQ